MILQRAGTDTLAITQVDHARLAADLATHWATELRLDRWNELVTATARHDDGWRAWDASPTISPAGFLHDFITVPIDERIEIYRRGAAEVAGAGEFVELLVSLHLTGLLNGRFRGEAAGLVDHLEGSERRVVEEFIHTESSRQRRIEERTRPPTGHYEILQAFDRLSLALTMQPNENLTRTRIDRVPGLAGENLDVWHEGGRIVLDPYPLETEDLGIRVPARVLTATQFGDTDECRAALDSAEGVTLTFRMMRA